MTQDIHIVSVSGGKDSTALYCWAIKKFGRDGFKAVFADTGHEHPVTYNYVRNMPEMAGGPEIVWVKGDFTERVAAKGKTPTGNPFLDMMLWKGRAPSSKAQFCTEHLKLNPIRDWMRSIRGDAEIENYIGIRAEESVRRSTMPEREFSDYHDCYVNRPLLLWSREDIFTFLNECGVPPNPLYALGYGRVGCFPCIHANKNELSLLPEWAWEKLADWEKKIGRTWFAPGMIPRSPEQKAEVAKIMGRGIINDKDEIAYPDCDLEAWEKWKLNNLPTIAQVREWCRTTHGGRQFNLFAADAKDVPSCMSTWGICE